MVEERIELLGNEHFSEAILREYQNLIMWEDSQGSHEIEVVDVLGEGQFSRVYLGEDGYAYSFAPYHDATKVLLASYSQRYPDDNNLIHLETLGTIMRQGLGLAYVFRSEVVSPVSEEDCQHALDLLNPANKMAVRSDYKKRKKGLLKQLRKTRNLQDRRLLESFIQLENLLVEMDFHKMNHFMDLHCANFGMIGDKLVVVDPYVLSPTKPHPLVEQSWYTDYPVFSAMDLIFKLPTQLIDYLLRTRTSLNDLAQNEHLTNSQKTKLLNQANFSIDYAFAWRNDLTSKQLEIILNRIPQYALTQDPESSSLFPQSGPFSSIENILDGIIYNENATPQLIRRAEALYPSI